MQVKKIIKELILWMNADNDCNFHPSKENKIRLIESIKIMKNSGFIFTNENISMIITGEVEEVKELYEHIPGFSELSECLNDIFNFNK
jgi:hypothetical protein